jgi:hypothetical protein
LGGAVFGALRNTWRVKSSARKKLEASLVLDVAETWGVVNRLLV